MRKDPTEFRKRFAAWKAGQKPYKGGVPYDDDNHNPVYDHARAAELGYQPDETGHYPTRDYETGRYLKSPAHPTVMKSVVSDLGEGYIPYYNNGQLYSDTWVKPYKQEDVPIPYRYKDGKLPGYKNGLDDTIDFLKQYEGFKDTTYLDGNGVPTIGYGFTDSSLVKKGKISRAEADRQLRKEVLKRESNLQKLKHWDKLNENSKTALRSYYYNYPAGFKDTTKFIKYWNAGDFENAIREVDAGMNDKKNPGLKTRRLQEQSMLRQDPFLTKRVSPLVRQLEETQQFNPVQIQIPVDRTDYSLQNASMQSRAPRNLNAWVGDKSPSYGGASVRMPSLQEYMNQIGSLLIGFKDGKSPIYIKPSHRGRLTELKKRTGKSESELYNDGNPAHKKMVVFARNARKWKH